MYQRGEVGLAAVIGLWVDAHRLVKTLLRQLSARVCLDFMGERSFLNGHTLDFLFC